MFFGVSEGTGGERRVPWKRRRGGVFCRLSSTRRKRMSTRCLQTFSSYGTLSERTSRKYVTNFRLPLDKPTHKTGRKRVRVSPPRGRILPSPGYKDVKIIDPITLDVLELWVVNRNDVKENRIFYLIPPEKSTRRKGGTKRARVAPPRRRMLYTILFWFVVVSRITKILVR